MNLRLIPLDYYRHRLRALHAARRKAERSAAQAWHARQFGAPPEWERLRDRVDHLERVNEQLWKDLEDVRQQRDRLLLACATDRSTT